MTRDNDDELSFGEQLERDRLDRRPDRGAESQVADFDAARQRRERAKERALRRSTGTFPAVQEPDPAAGTPGSAHDTPAPGRTRRRTSRELDESPSGAHARVEDTTAPPRPEVPPAGDADRGDRPRRSRHARSDETARDELSDTAAGLVRTIRTADDAAHGDMPEAAYVPVPTQPALSCSGLRKSFRGAPVLQDLDLDVAEHEVVVLIGASGSGKSTLLRCINLLEEIDDGTILLDGEHITDPRVNPDTVRRKIGMVFQSYNLFPHMTVLQNITLAPERVHRRRRAEVEAEARGWLERVGLGDKAREYPDRLSGGQQQRVAIVRALVNSPRLLLLDEVTSALDPELVGEVLTMIKDLKTEGMTMILATHEMAFARQVADRVCFLDGGRVLEQGPPEQVFGSPQHPRTRQFLRRIIDAGRL